MTTELTLREKVLKELARFGPDPTRLCGPATSTLESIASLLSATGAPAYIRVADDLRGVVVNGGESE